LLVLFFSDRRSFFGLVLSFSILLRHLSNVKPARAKRGYLNVMARTNRHVAFSGLWIRASQQPALLDNGLAPHVERGEGLEVLVALHAARATIGEPHRTGGDKKRNPRKFGVR
jgi:hypothetical protein